MGAKFSPLYDIRQAKSITISGQSSLLILMHDIRNVPSVRTVELNTDAIQFEIDEDKLPLAESILNNWQKRYRLELEREDILKLVMRDVNNYASIIKTPYGEEVNCKGSCFAGVPKIKIHDDGKLETIYKHDFKQNSMVVVREALLKKLLFNIPIEKTINNCSEIECFQIITHLGGSYEKCVQESEQGDILLQRNNRIYAGKKTSGKIIKVKYDGRRDSLANCPPNPIVDNANKCSIEDVNKEWYIDLAKQWADDFLGIKRLDEYKKDELLDMAINMGLEVDKKTKKAVLVELIKQQKKERKTMAKNVGNHFVDITGNRYGHLVVLGFDHMNKYHKSYWKCRCDCGNEFVRAKSRIRLSPINTCGKCNYTKLEKRYTTTHGDSPKSSRYHRLYNIWHGMYNRCYCAKHTYYHRYGGRGIKICDDWLGTNGYINFKEWALNNGYKDNLTIERKDYNGNYCPENCCWITMLEQHKNTSKVIKIPYNNKIYTLHEFCKKYHTSYATVKKYIINGNMSAETFIEYRNNKQRKRVN